MKASQIEQAARRKLNNFFAGITEYAGADIAEYKPKAKLIWREGTTKIWDFSGQKYSNKGKTVLVIPPLINRADILDFGASSLMKHLAENGCRALLVDWDEPGDAEKNFTSTKYISRLQKFCKTQKGKINIIGYCMGGIFALKLAEKINPQSLVLLATPWDVKGKIPFTEKSMNQMLENFEFVPAEFINSFFAYADMFSVYDKFAGLHKLDAKRKKEFFAIEKWVNSGVAMSVPLAKEFMVEWGIKNRMEVDFGSINCPCLLVAATQDKVVPVNSSLPLMALLNNVSLLKLQSGHIGIITKKLVHKPLTDWLRKL